MDVSRSSSEGRTFPMKNKNGRRNWRSFANFFYTCGCLGVLATKNLPWLYSEIGLLDYRVCKIQKNWRFIYNIEGGRLTWCLHILSVSIGYYSIYDGPLLCCLLVINELMTNRILCEWFRPTESKNLSDSCTGCFTGKSDILNLPNKRQCNMTYTLQIVLRKWRNFWCLFETSLHNEMKLLQLDDGLLRSCV